MTSQAIEHLALVIDRFHEAVAADPTGTRTKRALARKLKPKIARVFAEQGRLVLAGLEKQRSKLFAEAAAPKPNLYDWILTALEKAEMGKPIDEAVRSALLAGAATLVKTYGGVAFDLGNPRAVEYLREAVNRSKQIDAETFDGIRALLRDGVSEGRSYSSLARDIRRRFDGFAGKLPQKHIRDRAELIAVTEIGDAYSQGTLIQAEQLKRGGMEMEKSWLTVGDDRVSDGCADNEAAGWIDIDDDFPSGDDAPLRFPGCRCSLLTRRKAA
jgi:SPP1 gp7 family putative phage head morphogenesis protein